MFAVVVAAVITLLGGFLLKAQCLDPRIWDGRQYGHLCYNDLQALYGIRGLQQTFPYVNGELVNGELVNGAIEYPVLTGVFMWVSAQFASDFAEYLRVSALLLAPFGFLIAYLLARMSGWRALLWVAAPAIVLYAFHNWDLLVVAAVVGGFWFWRHKRYLWAAVLFGIGASLKMYPILFLAPLALERWHAREPSRALGALGAGTATFAAVNLPFLVANFDGWIATYVFHSRRGPNWDAIWSWLPFELPFGLDRVTASLLAGTFLAVLAAGQWRARRTGVYPFVQVCGALLAGFLLWNKVHSPQYTLWILPFFVLLRVNVGWWLAYTVVDLAVYVGVFRWFYDFGSTGSIDVNTPAKLAMVSGVWARAALLVVLIVVFLRTKSAIAPDDARVESHPPSSVGSVGETQPA